MASLSSPYQSPSLIGRVGVGLFLFMAVLLFFSLAYPHHLHYQEQYQLFLFDSAYVLDVVRLPGGVADLLGRFCTQFFLFAWVGAFIIALLLSAVQLLTLRLADWGKLYGLSYVPSFLLWMFLLDENALLGGVWATLLTLMTACVMKKTGEGKSRTITVAIAIPLLYWMAGPVCIALPFLLAPHPKRNPWYFAVFLIYTVMLLGLAHFIPVPASKLWTGIHYHRYPTVVPVLLWTAMLSALVLAFAVHIVRGWANAPHRFVMPLGSLGAVVIIMGSFVWKECNFKAEKIMQYDFMVSHQQWNRILNVIDRERPNNQIGVTVQNLALGMQGMLAQQLFQYNQNGMLGLLPDVQRDATSPMPTAEAFYQLGMVYVAQRTVFEAQEAILDFQKSARCYKRLAETNLITGSYEVSRKYLTALQKTLFYRQWANETMQLLGDEKTITAHPEYGRLRKMAYKDDFYFSDHVTPDMLKDLYLSNKDNALAYQYMMASFMLTGDRESFYQFTSLSR